MKKIVLLALAFGALAFVPVGGSAATTACNGQGGFTFDEVPTSKECIFTARGAETYWVASSNAWKFVVKRGTTTIQTVNGGPGTLPTGTLNSRSGDKVTFTATSTCAAGYCFLNYFIEIGATPADWFAVEVP